MKLVSHGSGEITVCNFTAGCQAEADLSEGGDHCDDDFSSSSSVLPIWKIWRRHFLMTV